MEQSAGLVRGGRGRKLHSTRSVGEGVRLGWGRASYRSRSPDHSLFPCWTSGLNNLMTRFQGRTDCRQPPWTQLGRRQAVVAVMPLCVGTYAVSCPAPRHGGPHGSAAPGPVACLGRWDRGVLLDVRPPPLFCVDCCCWRGGEGQAMFCPPTFVGC